MKLGITSFIQPKYALNCTTISLKIIAKKNVIHNSEFQIMQDLDLNVTDQVMKTCIHAAVQKNPAESGKGLAIRIPNARTLLNVENTIATLIPHLQITVAFKNLTAAIKVCQLETNALTRLLDYIYYFCLANRSLSCYDLDDGIMECREQDATCTIKKIGMFYIQDVHKDIPLSQS